MKSNAVAARHQNEGSLSFAWGQALQAARFQDEVALARLQALGALDQTALRWALEAIAEQDAEEQIAWMEKQGRIRGFKPAQTQWDAALVAAVNAKASNAARRLLGHARPQQAAELMATAIQAGDEPTLEALIEAVEAANAWREAPLARALIEALGRPEAARMIIRKAPAITLEAALRRAQQALDESQAGRLRALCERASLDEEPAEKSEKRRGAL